MIRLIARKRFTHAGRTYTAGDALSASPLDAASLVYRKVAGFAPAAVAAPVVAPSPVEEPSSARRRGTYRRRDLTAEGA